MAKIILVTIPFLLLCLTKSSTSQTVNVSNEPDCPVIETTLGKIAGFRQHTELGNKTFCSYCGIPYAEAPIGALRFKEPKPAKPWNGTFNATQYGSFCKQFTGTIIGSEDCLFLNVFVPEPSTCSNSPDIAVIVFIHGGGFIRGGANDVSYGPHLLLNECVILVTLNYRLHVFGFLSLAFDNYYGNMGLKDQQLVLKWVKKNIFAFGGNPKKVTLMGHSSGGSAASLHRLNPTSTKCFNQTYIMSGCAISYYVVSESNNQTDIIVNIARSQGMLIKNSKQLINYLQIVDADFILSQTIGTAIWEPCIEPQTSLNPFLTEDPETLLSKSETHLPPTIYTYTSLEGIYSYLDFIANPEKISYLNTNFTAKLPFHGLNQTACKKELANITTKIRRFYFGNGKIDGSKILPFIQLVSFNLPYFIQKEVAIQALSKSCAALRLLRINLRTLLSLSLNQPGVAALAGTSHTDDIFSYFWSNNAANLYKEIESKETLQQQLTLRTSMILRELLWSFAITGNPVSKTAEFNSFPSVGSDPLTDLPFTELMSISALGSGSNPDHEEFTFWWDINMEVNEIRKMSCNQK